MAFYNKIKPFIYQILLLLILSPSLKGQETGSYWQIDYAKGSIIKHKKIVSSLFIEYPNLTSIGWHKTAKNGTLWKERYNYPDWGFVFMYQQFNNVNLGETASLNYTTTYYLRDRNAKNQLKLQIGFGSGYNTKPLDFETNLSNIVMTSHFLFSQHFKFNYTHSNIFNGVGLHTGITFTHFSNGGFKKPNLGINSIFLNLGLSYDNRKASHAYTRLVEKENFSKQPIHFSLSINGGFHETKPRLGLDPVYFISGFAHKRIGYKSGLQIGLDFFNSQSIKEYAYYRNLIDIENSDSKAKDHRQLGVFVGHEWFFNKLSLETQLGYYLYKPFDESAPIYQKISFKYFLNKNKSALSVNLKIHYFNADFISLGVHRQIF